MIWWLVDFVRPYYIGEVFLVGRKDCCWERTHDFQIRIGNSGGVSSLLNPQCGGLHSLWEPHHIASLSVYCEPYSYGRYLTVAKEAVVNDISLAEVAVFQLENGKRITSTVEPRRTATSIIRTLFLVPA